MMYTCKRYLLLSLLLMKMIYAVNHFSTCTGIDPLFQALGRECKCTEQDCTHSYRKISRISCKTCGAYEDRLRLACNDHDADWLQFLDDEDDTHDPEKPCVVRLSIFHKFKLGSPSEIRDYDLDNTYQHLQEVENVEINPHVIVYFLLAISLPVFLDILVSKLITKP